MPPRIAIEAAYAFTDEELTAWIAKSGWGKPVLFIDKAHPHNASIAKVIAAFPA